MLLIIIIVSILFFPFKLKLYVELNRFKGTIILYFYKFPINLNSLLNAKKISTSIRQTKSFSKTLNKILDFITFFNALNFKPRLKQSATITFGLGDAFLTAMIMGILSPTISAGKKLADTFFHLKQWDIVITPTFNSDNLDLKSTSIIHISIANAIYILVCYIIWTRKHKRSC